MEQMSKKDLILKESYKLFLSKGYDAISLTDIERHAKVTRGAIFHHFHSKEDLFKQVAERFVFSFLEDEGENNPYLEGAMPLKGFISNRLHIIKRRMEYFYREVDNCITPASFMAFILYLKDHYDDWSERIDTYEKHKLQLWEKVICLAKKRQEIKEDSDIERLALTFHNLYLGLSYQGALIDKLSIAQLEELWDYIYLKHTT
ncbi:TetR/AcrR family transcriptional regulator [Porphyromonas cangingivalis]|uniref:TetR/AcrR family transcriptional regulator n=1 Tax=Porphyromonas cangingivalis TaxID=36874 RepID=UPI00242DC7F9|nr:TetR/AcrR family transcriptional regulator [Porphyromonas cangingivalis]